MKSILILLLIIFNLNSYSQLSNGGQFNENDAIRVTYFGFTSGTHTFKVNNKQVCDAILRTKIDNEPDIDFQVNTNDSFFVNVFRQTLDNVKFKVKPETRCDNKTDIGWVELNSAGFVLPLVENNLIRFIRGKDEYKVSLRDNILISDFGSLSEKQTIIIHNINGYRTFFTDVFVRKKLEINLTSYLKSGINFITVLIHNKVKDNFTFKTYKL